MFSLRPRREKPVLILDIEGGSVAAAVVLLRAGQPAHVIMCERAVIPPTEREQVHHSATTLTHARETLASILKKYTDNQGALKYGVLETPYVIVGVPWVRSHSLVAEEENKVEKTITDAHIKNLAKQSLNQPSVLNAVHVFETNVTRVQLNGYPTGKPIGKRAHHLSVTVFQSEIVPEFKQGIVSLVGEFLPGRDVDFRSATGVALSILQEKTTANHYLYISIGSTDTDCIAAHKEDVNEHATIPVGTSALTQRLAGESGMPEEVFSLLRMLMNDTCATPACGALKTSLAKLEPELVKMFGDAFAKIATKRKIPNLCFLSAHPDMAPWFEHFFARIDFAQFTVTAQPMSVTLLTPNHLQKSVIWSETREDTGIALAAAFVNTLNH